MLLGRNADKIRGVHIETHLMNFHKVLTIFRLPYDTVTHLDVASVDILDDTFVVGFHDWIALLVIPAAVADRNNITLFKHIKFASYPVPFVG